MRRWLTVAGMVLAGGCAVAPLAGATESAPATKDRVVRDCLRHASLTRAYTAGRLRRSLAAMPADVAEYTACPAAIRSQLSGLSGRPGRSAPRAVLRDITRHGYLRHAFARRVLVAALTQLAPDMAEYTAAEAAIKSQLVLFGSLP